MEYEGVRFRPKTNVTQYSGREGFRSFMDDVYLAAVNDSKDFRIQNARPSNWYKHLGEDWYEMHAARMKQFADKISFKITCCEGDNLFIASGFAEYRWVKEKHFNDQSIYIYGEKVAFLNFQEDDVDIVAIDNPDITRTLTQTFDYFWEHNTFVQENDD